MSNRGPSMVLGNVQWGPDRYPVLWVWEQGEYHCFSLHRLALYADGELDHPCFDRDPREVHHVDGDIWNSDPENLEAHTPEHHGRITRGVVADGGQTDE